MENRSKKLEVLKKDLERPIDSVRAKRPKQLPTVLTKEEVLKVIGFLSGTHHLCRNSGS